MNLECFMNLILISLLTTLVVCQENTSNATLSGSTNTTNRTDVCDPTLSVCPNSDSCDVSAVKFGGFILTSPNSSTFAIMNQSFDVTWNYTPTTNTSRFPVSNITLYYQRVGINDWTFLSTYTGIRNDSKTSVTLPTNLIPSQYKLRILADDIEINPQSNVGRRVSCPADGFPAPGTSQAFFVIRPKVETDFAMDGNQPEPYAPNTAVNGHPQCRRHSSLFLMSLVLVLYFL